MDLGTFYALMSGTCFTLVGLWWTVVERHPDWKGDPRRRKLAGGTYLSFLLPGVMALFAQVAPEQPLLWRTSFALAALLGLWNTVKLMGLDRGEGTGAFRKNRWAVALVYLLIAVLGAAPELVRGLGLVPIQVGAFLLVLLVLLAHALTWEFLMEPDEAQGAAH